MRKRIVFLAAHLLSPSLASGGDVLFCQIGKALRNRRDDWEILCVAPDFAQAQLGVYFERIVPIATCADEGVQGSPLSAARTWWRRTPRAARALEALEPQLVHSTGDFFVDVWPAVHAMRNRGAKWSGVVYHINAPPFARRNNVVVAAASFAFQRASFRALKRADSVAVLNEGVRQELIRLGFCSDRVHVTGAGIDPQRFSPVCAARHEKRAVWVNRLEPTKGMFDIPAIVQRLPAGVALDIIGRGPDIHVRRLRRALQRAGLTERCVLHGFLPDQEVRAAMEQAGVFISCSYEEGWGISIAEALAMGLPCVAYDLQSHREIFGDAIVRVPIGDTQTFAKRIVEILGRQESESTRKARRTFALQYSLDACSARIERIFESLLSA